MWVAVELGVSLAPDGVEGCLSSPTSPGMPFAVKKTTGIWVRTRAGPPGGGPTSRGTALLRTTRAGHQSCPSTLAQMTRPGRRSQSGRAGCAWPCKPSSSSEMVTSCAHAQHPLSTRAAVQRA